MALIDEAEELTYLGSGNWKSDATHAGPIFRIRGVNLSLDILFCFFSLVLCHIVQRAGILLMTYSVVRTSAVLLC